MNKLLIGAVLIWTLVFASGCGKFFFQPDHEFYYPPDKNGYQPDDVWFKSGDGNDLHAWFFFAKKKPAKGTIVQFHGNSQNISSHYASLAWLIDQGYNLFTFDYRGYGDSPGIPNDEGVYKDGMAALDKAWELHRKTKAPRFVVYAQSLGGLIGMRSFGDFRHQNETDLLVMDSTFVSYKDLVQEKMANMIITWPFSWMGRFLVSDKFASEPVVPRVKTRLLVIHDHNDPVVEYQNGEKLYRLATNASHKDFWELNEGRHVALFWLDTPANRTKFLTLLESLR